MPTGNDVTQRRDLKPAFSDNLFERVLQRGNLQAAWKRVRANKGAAGVDGMTIDEFPDWAKSGEWKRVVTELETGRYQPAPVRRVEIDKPDGGIRHLGIPTVIDRVIQQAIAQVLTPIFDPGFSDHSFGFRPGRNGQQAVKQVQRVIKDGRRIAVDVDLSKFFDRVNHDLLMTHLGYKIKDKRVLRLIKRYLRAGVIDNSSTARAVKVFLRVAYWRQWRKPRTKVRSLLRLGVHIQSAVACGITSKGPWRSSKSPGIQQALSNAYLKSQGLVALRDGWIKLHYSK